MDLRIRNRTKMSRIPNTVKICQKLKENLRAFAGAVPDGIQVQPHIREQPAGEVWPERAEAHPGQLYRLLCSGMQDPFLPGMKKIWIRDPGQTSRRIRNTVFYTPGTFNHCSFHGKERYESILIEDEQGIFLWVHIFRPCSLWSKVQ